MTSRDRAFGILLRLWKKMERLEDVLSGVELSSRERKFLHNLVSGVVRHRSLLDWKASQLYNGNYKKTLDKFKIIMQLAIYELDHLDFIPPHATVNEYVSLAKRQLPTTLKNIINGMLRTYLREGKGLQPKKAFKFKDTQLAVTYSYPEWIIKRWLHFFGAKETENLCRSMNQRPDFDLRIHLSKIGFGEFITILSRHKITFTPSTLFNNVVAVTDIGKLMQLGLLEKGFCSVQDESGQIVTECLQVKEGERILDACAAPGSKFTHLKETVSDQLTGIALEINGRRLLKVRENCRRLKLNERFIVQGDAVNLPFNKKFDKILVDAPCSGLGTIQKHPDIKWRRTIEEIMQFQSLQLTILLSVEKMLTDNGILLYSTCTVDPAENEEVIDRFIQSCGSNYKVITPPVRFKKMITPENYLRTWPHHHSMEGSFTAILQKLK